MLGIEPESCEKQPGSYLAPSPAPKWHRIFRASSTQSDYVCLKVLRANGNGEQADSKATFGELVVFCQEA